MKEILPGLFHWTVTHPGINSEVSSYYLSPERVVLDPMVPDEGLDLFERGVDHVILTNRHHYRDSRKFAERYGCTVWCVRHGLHEFTRGEEVKPFDFGQTLPGKIEAVEIGGICPDDTALYIPRPGGVLALADCAVREEDGPLGFVPEQYMGEEPEAVKTAVKISCRRVLEREFDHLLLAHGWPVVGGGKKALREFAEV